MEHSEWANPPARTMPAAAPRLAGHGQSTSTRSTLHPDTFRPLYAAEAAHRLDLALVRGHLFIAFRRRPAEQTSHLLRDGIQAVERLAGLQAKWRTPQQHVGEGDRPFVPDGAFELRQNGRLMRAYSRHQLWISLG